MFATALKEKEKEWHKNGKLEGIRETARNLKAGGVAIDIIVQVTGLGKEEVERL